MFDPAEFRDLVSGRKQGLSASLLRSGLRVLEIPYTLAVRWRNRRYDRTRSAIQRVSVPVVSVGNLTLGGTGKTPMVQWVARRFREHGIRVTIVSRGYGAESGSLNDEALELEQMLPDVPHLQNPDRVAASWTAIEEFDCQLIVLDDAFQHRRIDRDLDIVMLDATEPFGFGHVFPRGMLREPISGVARAHVVALARADMIERRQRDQIRCVVERYAPDAVWAEVVHWPQALVNAGGDPEPIESLKGASVAAFCGIGNPHGFRHTLNACGYEVRGFRQFPDHHRYRREDIESLSRWANDLDVSAVLCTYKDLVKIRAFQLGRHPLRALSVGLEYLCGQKDVKARLEALIESALDNRT